MTLFWFLDTPNFFIAFGEDGTGTRPASEVICMSQKPDDESLVKYNLYCSNDGKRDFARGVYGAILLPLQADFFNF